MDHMCNTPENTPQNTKVFDMRFSVDDPPTLPVILPAAHVGLPCTGDPSSVPTTLPAAYVGFPSRGDPSWVPAALVGFPSTTRKDTCMENL